MMNCDRFEALFGGLAKCRVMLLVSRYEKRAKKHALMSEEFHPNWIGF
ncbi:MULTISPECIES: hypothetical protein [Microcoleaceae]|nr:hypothetical protein [Tychonema sp. LEGE 06208]MBE9162885.1 hypothetical protein [Tychonema sp. LEGE 06208]